MKITDTSGKEHDISCIACAIQDGTIDLPIERVHETEHFVVEQDLEYPIEGFLIVASKRHITSVMDMTEEESGELGKLLRTCRQAMQEVLNIKEVTLVQEETSSSSHFHVWLFPWLNWMSVDKKKIDRILEIMRKAKEERVGNEESEEMLEKATASLKEYMDAH
ncbi:MAG: hypothetical protein H8D63_00565 [Parcubacteria group bacterium]|nr:hypothetical protein [Parcubacteria group bacterium]